MQHGRAATAFQTLESGFAYWRDPHEPDAIVAYVDTGGAWVAASGPLAPPAAQAAVAKRFVAAARAAGARAVFFASEDPALLGDAGASLRLGGQPLWDPRDWERTLADARSLRYQVRRAKSKDVGVRRVAADALRAGAPLRTELEQLLARWDARHAMAAMAFLVTLEPFVEIASRRVFVAERHGVVVGFLSLAPVPARNGWLFEDLIRAPDAPNGTSELLVDAAMRDIAADGATCATLGLAPLSGEVSPWLARARRFASPFFNFRGLAAFKARLRPERWDDLWLVHPRDVAPWRAMLDALTAFAGGSLLRFGIRTLRRGPPPVIAAMSLLLVPWTLVLARLDVTRWYPAPWLRATWVSFDATLCVLLFLLARRWHRGWGRTAAVLVTLDASITIGQGFGWYAPRATSIGAWLGLFVACAAPTLAAAVLWGAVRRHRVIAHG